MKHHGEIFEKAVRNSKYSITEVARQSNLTTRTLYNWFEKDELQFDIFLSIGKIIGYDFSEDLPALTKYLMVKEPQEVYDANNAYKQKYLELLEKHMLLIDELKAIKGVREPVVYKKSPVKKRIK